MTRKPVKSSSVTSIGYDSRWRELEIEYTGGKAYRYQRVPRKIFDELMQVESKGIYVNTVIKPRFRYELITEH